MRTASYSHLFTSLNKLSRSAIFLSALAWFLGTCRRCWRRAALTKRAHAQQVQPNDGNTCNGQPPSAPQYPLQAHGGPGGGVPDYTHDPNAGLASVRLASSPPFLFLTTDVNVLVCYSLARWLASTRRAPSRAAQGAVSRLTAIHYREGSSPPLGQWATRHLGPTPVLAVVLFIRASYVFIVLC